MNNLILQPNSSLPATSDNIKFSDFFWGDHLIVKQQDQYTYLQTYVKGSVTRTVEYDAHGQTLHCNRQEYRFIKRRIVAKLVPITVVDTEQPCFWINFYNEYLERYPQLRDYFTVRCGESNLFLPKDLPEYDLLMGLASQVFGSVSHSAAKPQAASAPSSKQSKRTVAKPAPSNSATKPQAASAPSPKQSKRTVAKPAPSNSAAKPQAALAPSSKKYSVPKK